MPRLPLAPISTAEEVRPAAPMSWIAIDGAGRHQFEAGFEQQLLGEGVADLNGRALLLGVGLEGGGSHGRAMDAVAPGLGAEIDDRIADAGGRRIEDRSVLARCRPPSH